MKSSIFLRFFFLFFIWIESCLSTVEVTWVDVGQGDCSLSKFSAPLNSRIPALIVDGGSSKNTSGSNKENKKVPVSIRNNVFSTLNSFFAVDSFKEKVEQALPDLYIIVTHGDEDHFYFLSGMVQELEEKHRVLDIRFILGGAKLDFYGSDSGFNNRGKPTEGKLFYDYVAHRCSKDAYKAKYGEFLVGSMSNPPSVLNFFANTKIDILSALTGDDKNANSVVSKLTHGTTSVLFTGDATRDTLAEARKSPAFQAPTTLLQLPHHGSSTHGSEEWSSAVGACYYSCSSGVTTYKHPQHETIFTLLRNRRDSKPFFFIKTSAYDESVAQEFEGSLIPIGVDERYIYSAARVPLFSTVAQGNIKFIFNDQGILQEPYPTAIKKPNQFVTSDDLSQPLVGKAFIEVMRNFYITKEAKVLFLDGLEWVVLDELNQSIFEAPALEKLSLRKNKLNSSNKNFISELIKIGTLKHLDLSLNEFDEECILSLKEEWIKNGKNETDLLL